MPDFSTLSRRQKGLNVAIPYRPTTGVLHLEHRKLSAWDESVQRKGKLGIKLICATEPGQWTVSTTFSQ